MNELTFLDLIILKKTDADSSVEKFGSLINTSFFETANLLGTVKIKGYINIESSIGGISKVIRTDAGEGILALAAKKAIEPIEPLDNALLHAVAGGAKEMSSIQSALNVRSGDLAYHINKMVEQGYMDYEARSAKVSFVLTEQGFNSTGGVRVAQGPQTTLAGAIPKEGDADKGGKKEKEDVAQLLKGEHEAHHEHAHHGHEHHEHAHPHPEHEHAKHEHAHHEHDEKGGVKHRRMFSKITYYIAEYWLWVLLLIIVAAIFAGAIMLWITKGKLAL